MKIVIMGSGAMACLFGCRMLNAGHEVWLVTKWAEQAEQILREGLVLQEEGQKSQILHPHVVRQAADSVSDGRRPDLLMVSSKTYRTGQTIQDALPAIGPETRVLTLQNGLGNGDVIAEYVDPSRVFYGGASVAAVVSGLGIVRDNTNRNRTPLIGIVPLLGKENAFCHTLRDLFSAMGYPTQVGGPAAERFVWKKLCLNCCGNALAGISQLPNGIYSIDQDGFILLNQLCGECVAVARAKGVELYFDEVRAFIQATFHNSAHYISMCQDMHRQQPTEIDCINGAIIREGHRLGIPTPVNETLYHLVRLISNHYSQRWTT